MLRLHLIEPNSEKSRKSGGASKKIVSVKIDKKKKKCFVFFRFLRHLIFLEMEQQKIPLFLSHFECQTHFNFPPPPVFFPISVFACLSDLTKSQNFPVKETTFGIIFFLCLNDTNRVNSNYIHIENISQQLGYLYTMTSNYYGFEQRKLYFDTKYQKAK